VSAHDPAPDGIFDALDPEDRDDEPSGGAECGSCPLGFLRDLSREAQPEATLHLLAAARELLLAMETVVRAAEVTVQRNAGQPAERDTSPAPPRVRRIDIV
jgi:hypothetical protein